MVAPPAAADDPVRYRVELIVVRHLDTAADPSVEPVLEDYSDALDIVPKPPGDDEGDQQAAGSEAPIGVAAGTDAAVPPSPPASSGLEPGMSPSQIDDESPGLFELEELPPPPPPAVWVETPGDTMEEAWRRLRLSAGFRPELYFSWEQPDTAPFPRIRVHDDRVIYVDDPFADLRDGTTEAGSGGESGPTGSGSADDVVAVYGDTVSGQAGAGYEPGDAGTSAAQELPEPTLYYALDGTARLRRSRFLHLDLDLAWRERVAMTAPTPGDGGSSGVIEPVAVAGDPLATPPDAVRLHRLRQSRQVRTGDIQYFDGPFIGVLALITRIEPTEGVITE